MNRKIVSMAVFCCLLAAALSACGKDSESKVAGASTQKFYGYILDVNEQGKTVTVDRVELISPTDTDRLNAISGEKLHRMNDRYVYNETVSHTMYPLGVEAVFDLTGSSAASRLDNGGYNDLGYNTDNGNGYPDTDAQIEENYREAEEAVDSMPTLPETANDVWGNYDTGQDTKTYREDGTLLNDNTRSYKAGKWYDDSTADAIGSIRANLKQNTLYAFTVRNDTITNITRVVE